MSALPLALVLASALLHAGWNALLKRAQDLEAASTAVFLMAMAATALLSLLLPGPAFPTPEALAWAVAAGLGEGAYFTCLTRTLQRAPLGWAYAWMRGSSVVFAWPAAVALLGEPIGIVSGIAVATVVAGLLLMGVGAHATRRRGALGWAVAAGLFIAAFNAAYKAALDHGAEPAGLFALAMAVGVPIQVAVRAATAGPRAALRPPGRLPYVLVTALVCTLAFLAYLGALQAEGSGRILTIRNTSVVFALLLGVAMGERPPGRQWVGAVLVSAGAAALAWGG